MKTLARLLVVAGALAWAHTATADMIYSVTFDSATGTATGSAIAGVTGGTAEIKKGTGVGTSSSVAFDPSMGAGGFLHAVCNPNCGTDGATLKPAAPQNSLDALFSYNANNKVSLNGAIDFFFRTDNPINVANELLAINSTAPTASDHGLQLQIRSSFPATADSTAVESDFQLRVGFWNPNATDSAGNPDPGVRFVTATAPTSFQIEANQIYHLGLTMTTNANGLTTARLFAVAGTGAIDTSSTTNLLIEGTFNLNENFITHGFTTGEYEFGSRNAGSPKAQDFDTYRLYNSDPAIFAAQVPDTGALAQMCIALGALLGFRRGTRV